MAQSLLFCREFPGASSVPMMSTHKAACGVLISPGAAARLLLENAALCDPVPLGILSGIMCSSQPSLSLVIQIHKPSERTYFLVDAQTHRPMIVHAALLAWLVFSIFALQKSCPSFKIQFKY